MILILHILHFITAHFKFITAHLCSDNPLFEALNTFTTRLMYLVDL